MQGGGAPAHLVASKQTSKPRLAPTSKKESKPDPDAEASSTKVGANAAEVESEDLVIIYAQHELPDEWQTNDTLSAPHLVTHVSFAPVL